MSPLNTARILLAATLGMAAAGPAAIGRALQLRHAGAQPLDAGVEPVALGGPIVEEQEMRAAAAHRARMRRQPSDLGLLLVGRRRLRRAAGGSR